MAEPTFAERLGRESERWVAEGLITAEQAPTLRARYEGAAAVREEPAGRAASALAVVDLDDDGSARIEQLEVDDGG